VKSVSRHVLTANERRRAEITAFVTQHQTLWNSGMMVLAVLYLAATVANYRDPVAMPPCVIILLSVMFAGEFFLRMWAATSRWGYVRGHWLDAISRVPAERRRLPPLSSAPSACMRVARARRQPGPPRPDPTAPVRATQRPAPSARAAAASAALYSPRARRTTQNYLRLRLLELREADLDRARAVIEHRLDIRDLLGEPKAPPKDARRRNTP